MAEPDDGEGQPCGEDRLEETKGFGQGRMMGRNDFGEGIVGELREQQARQVRKKRRARRLRRLIGTAVLVAAVGIFLYVQIKGNEHFETTYYTVESEKIENPIRIAVLSDLHDREFGEGNSELIEAIRNEDVDLVCMVGDMVNKEDTEISVVENLCAQLLEIAPVYYSFGNHEGTMRYGYESVMIDDILRGEGVDVLINYVREQSFHGEKLVIAGIATNEKEYDQFARESLDESFWDADGFKILLCHFPNIFYDKLADADFDLALAGHYHGGLIRLPYFGGLYHPEDGFFPKYNGGEYCLTNGTLIVSRGMGADAEDGKWVSRIPRINNRPELVVVEIR